ncbi:MAG TPA: histidine kinase [Acidimicrobiia bacterium]|nr:histidine kinase [Acidimicrobiia bacterium]
MSIDRSSIRWTDLLTAGLLTVLALLAVSINRAALPEFEEGLQSQDLALVALALSMAFRRRAPLTVLAFATVTFSVISLLHIPEGTISSIALFLALFSAGAYSHHRMRDWVRAAAVAVSMGALAWFIFRGDQDLPGGFLLYQTFSLLLNTAFFGVGWLMGDLWRKRAEDREELARRAEILERQRNQLAEQAVAAERLRIARELHDVVAHHVSLMGVQAGAARRMIQRDPAKVEEILSEIEATGREAVGEMGRLVGFIREKGELEKGEPVAPQPTLDRLDALVDHMRAAGLEITVHRVGRRRDLEPTVDLSAFRVVQEALTNALKHGSRPEVVVEIGYLVDDLSIRVRNPADTVPSNGSGRGLLGMRERVAVSGGRIHTGMRRGWFEVEARFPYAETS